MSNVINIVRESISFEDVARGYGIEFNRSGKALCPFHDEKTASFSLHPSGLYAKCFGCGVSVDVIEFEYRLGQHANRWEAAKALNDRYQLDLNFNGFDKEKAEEISKAYQLVEWYCNQTYEALLDNKEALDWLEKNKDITIEDVKQYRMGFVGHGWLTDKVTEKSRAIALKIGLLKEKDGKTYDAFWDRLIFSVYNYGKIVSLWTREFPDKENSQYKWIGLSNSELVPNKPVAWIENLNCDTCVVVEGITDAMAFIKAGIPACALLGKEVSKANRFYFEKAKGKVYFALDPDETGKKASYELARELKGYTLDLGYEKDSDEVLAHIGAEGFKKLVEKALERAPYYLDLVIERESKKEALKEIASLDMESDKDVWLKKLALKYKKDGATITSLRIDLHKVKDEMLAEERAKLEREKKHESQSHPRSEPIDLLAEQKPLLHPAMDWIEGNLAYGTSSGGASLLIHNRGVLDLSSMLQHYSVTTSPRPNRFSAYGIKSYAHGAEIRGPKLYKKIYNLLFRHVIFKFPWQINLIVIWIIGTYLHRCFPLYPYLWIQSPTKRSGKTRLLEILSELAFNSDGIQAAPTEAVLYRIPEISAGTLCWDEAENLHNHKEKGERLEILNAAYRKGAKIPRCEGEDHHVKFFEVFRPIALAGISSVPDTVADRSIKVELIRKKRSEKVKRLQITHLQSELQSLRDGLHIFALERTPIIMEAYSQFRDDLIPEGVDDRLRDALEILISIASGIYRYDKSDFLPILLYIKDAAKALSGIRIGNEGNSSFIQVISLFRAKMKGKNQDKLILSTKEAIAFFQDGGITWVEKPKHIYGIFNNFGIYSSPHWRDGKTIRGYSITLEEVEDLWQRYGVEEEQK